MSNPGPLKQYNVRLFQKDIELVKRIAAKQGLPWQIEFRLLVHRALKGESRSVLVLTEKSNP